MARQTRIRTKTQAGATEILVLVSHPMETGQRADPKTKEKIPAHFIQKMSFTLNGKEVAVADLGTPVSKDPLVGIKIKGAKAGDKVAIKATDSKGETLSGEATVA